MSADNRKNGHSQTTWQAYTDYEGVPDRMADSVAWAVEQYAKIHSLNQDGARPDPEIKALARTQMLAAAIRIKTELDQTTNEDADPGDNIRAEILHRWENGREGDDVGLIEMLHDEPLEGGYGSWLHQLVQDLRQAAWDLGYLQAGKHEKEYDDPTEQETEDMFQGL